MSPDSHPLGKILRELAAALKEFEERQRGFLSVRFDGTTSPPIAVGGYDHVLLTEAARSAERAIAAAASADATAQAGATAAAVLCAAAACEAWLSEYLTRVEFHAHGLPLELDRLRSERDAREQWKKLLRLRAPSFNCGDSHLFLSLGCLFKVRDHIAYRHARFARTGTLPPRLDDCVRQGTVPARAAAAADWTSVIFVHEVATWAHQTAREWLALANELLPIKC